MLTCREITEVCSAEMERPLKVQEWVSLQMHLMLCVGCTNYRRQLKTLRQVMATYAEGRACTEDSTAPRDD